MADDPIDRYQQALRRYNTAKAELMRAVEVIKAAAGALRQPAYTIVSDVGSYPATLPHHNTIPGKEWPAASDLARMLAGYQNALIQSQSSWERIPADNRVGLAGPPQE